MKKIIIGGDFMPTESNYNYFINNEIDKLFENGLFSLLNDSDYNIFNLEAPITNSEYKISKEGPNLKINPCFLNNANSFKVNLFSLSNNHILDFDEKGLIDTIHCLEHNKISYVGAGKNLEEACKIKYFELGNVKIGVYSCTEHEYSIATINTYGANPFDALYSLDHIKEAKENVDYLIVIYHGGKEYYKYPSPYLQKVCRRMVEKGADIVLCQHSHCIGSYENYNGSMILYGQGNFLFDYADKKHIVDEQTGLLVELIFNNKKVDVNFIPIIKNYEKVRLANEEEKNEIIKELEERSKNITNIDFITKQYRDLAFKVGGRYTLRLSKIGDLLSIIDNRIFKGKIFDRDFCFFNKRQIHTLENMLQCEVHNETVMTYLKNNYSKDGRK